LEDKFPKKTADAVMKVVDDDMEEKEESKDDMGYDELLKVVNELPDKIAAAMGKKKEGKDDARGERVVKEGHAADDEEEEMKDDDKSENDTEGEILARVKTLEEAVEKCLEFMSKAKGGDDAEEEEEHVADDEEEMGDDEEEMDDDDFENSTMVGDSSEVLSRAEILAPGLKKSKDIIEKALKTSYATKDGKKLLESLNGGKKLTFDSKENTAKLFIAASEVLKTSRSQELVNNRRKTNDYVPSLANENFVSAEKINEINAKFYKKA
jgi:hypothetical protein